MRRVLARLRSAQRWRAGDLGLRAMGLVSLAGCAALVLSKVGVHYTAAQPATATDFALMFMGFALWTVGAALVFNGQELFRPCPLPPRAWFAVPRAPEKSRAPGKSRVL